MVSPADTPSCRHREVLRARLRADLKVYREAVLDLQRSMGEEFTLARQRVERARLAFEAASQTLQSQVLPTVAGGDGISPACFIPRFPGIRAPPSYPKATFDRYHFLRYGLGWFQLLVVIFVALLTYRRPVDQDA